MQTQEAMMKLRGAFGKTVELKCLLRAGRDESDATVEWEVELPNGTVYNGLTIEEVVNDCIADWPEMPPAEVEDAYTALDNQIKRDSLAKEEKATAKLLAAKAEHLVGTPADPFN